MSDMSKPTKTHAEIIIIGGGIVGCSTAYHLACMGKKDVIILEKSALTHGATWHAAGLVGQLRSSRNTTRMLKKSVELYDQLAKETDNAIEWKKVGSLRLACSEDRMYELKRLATLSKSFDLEMELISASEAQKLFPVMSTEKVLGAAYIPSDGYIEPSSITHALAKKAREQGVKIVEGARVTGVTTKNKSIVSVETNLGTFTAETFVNAAGMWGQELGDMCGVNIPACALEHQYLVTDVIPDLPDNMPTMRDPDHLVYYKPECGALAIGGYEPDTLPFGKGGIPKSFGQELLQENFDRFEQLATNAALRTPVINNVGVRKLINGPIPYSADGDFVMGKAPELNNFFVATGFLYGIAAGGGAGQMMAEWIIGGEPSLDLWPLDIRRFQNFHGNPEFMFTRAIELYGKHYEQNYPGDEKKTMRGLRKGPLYEKLKNNGAVYGSKGGWERPNFFHPEGKEVPEDKYQQGSFTKPSWFEFVEREHMAVRNHVALIDQTSFSKFEVQGPKALELLQYLATSNLDKPVGSTMYTQLCNQRGGIEADLTINRLGKNHFYVVTGSTFGTHDYAWIESFLPDDGSVVLYDVTSAYSVINICGPDARNVLSQVTETNLSTQNFKFSTFQNVSLGVAPVRAIRIGYVGELGWELHIPTEFASYVYDLLWEKGQKYNITNVGYKAIDSLRMEKGYLYWSTDITPDYNPYEVGLGFRTHLKSKGDFLARPALESIKEKGTQYKLFTFTLDEYVPLLGGETIIHQDKVIGVTSSGNYGHFVKKSIAYGHIPTELEHENEFYLETYGKRYKVTKHNQALYDPKMERLKV